MFGIFDLLFPKHCLLCNREGKYMCNSCIGALPKAPTKKGVTIIFPYKGIIRKGIVALKYKFAFNVAGELADLVSKSIKEKHTHFPKGAILVPIPLHQSKEKYRGFNQVEEVGKYLAKTMGWSIIPNFLMRMSKTKSQANLKKEERLTNVKGAFRINPGYLDSEINKPLIVFDDVYTTGSTMSEATRVLKENGFKRVYPLVIAG